MTLSLLHAAREHPDRVALVVAGRSITYAELAARVTARASTLGISGGTVPVALVGASDLTTLETLYALIEQGRPVALLHPRLTAEERRALLERTGLTLLEPLPDGSSGRVPGDTVPPERPLAVVFTSGTEAEPKGVVLGRGAFGASARASEANLGWRDDDRWLLGLPVAHVGGLSVLTRCLIARRTVVVPGAVAEGRRFDGAALAASIDEDRVTVVSVVPTQLEWLLDSGFRSPPHLRAVLVGGAAASPRLLERAAERGIPVVTTYGLTEACSQVATQPFGSVNRGALGVGKPLDGIEVRLTGGRIAVRGPTLLSGYLGAPGPRGFEVVDPRNADGFFVTGDIGRFDDAGRLHVVGRASEVIVTGGENVSPSEVEAVLERCPGVSRACVFGLADDTWGELVAAALVPSPEGGPDDRVLADHVRSALSPHKRPRLIGVVPTLEQTPGGKIDRARTAEIARPGLRRLAGL